jgi:glycosyltransferase involved in cell wall biosynthesis
MNAAAQSRPSLLFVTPVPPAFDGIGIEMRAAANLAALARFFDVDLLVIDLARYLGKKTIDPEIAKLCRRTAIVPADESRLGSLYHKLSSQQLKILFRAVNPQAISLVLADARGPAIRGFLEGRSYDVVHAFRLKTASILPQILSMLKAPPRQRVLDLDDIESEFARRQAATLRQEMGLQTYVIDSMDVFKLKRRERQIARAFDHIYLCSKTDAERFRRMYGPVSNIEVVPNIVRRPAATGPDGSATEKRPLTLLFVGTLRYAPNVDALTFFHDEVMPRLRALTDLPFTVKIVGRSPVAKIQAMAKEPGFALVADAPDLAPHYTAADVVIAPIRFGGGTRIKIIEAFSYRRAVVSTALGAEGIEAEPGKELLIADDPEQFARHCADLMRDADYRQRIGDAGYGVFERGYSQSVLEKIMGSNFGLTAPANPG